LQSHRPARAVLVDERLIADFQLDLSRPIAEAERLDLEIGLRLRCSRREEGLPDFRGSLEHGE
jgi:hypothetical protein